MTDHLIHLVCGSTGAGKTTYSIALCERLGAVRFSIDEWMTALFWSDAPKPMDAAWAMARVERCNAQIWSVAREIGLRGLPCVLDLGFTTRASRDRFANLAGDAGLTVQLHWLDVPADERWVRVQRRNDQSALPTQLKFAVTREMFEYVEGLWQPPTADEMASRDGITMRAPG